MEPILRLYHKYREMFLYLVTGVLTTIINYGVYLACSSLLPVSPSRTVLSTLIAWAISVLFAYLTNRIWVFRSQAKGFGPLLREFMAFLSARVLSGILDMGIMYVLVDLMGFNDKVIKLASNVLVVVLNYIFSKLFIFKKTKA